MLELFTEALGEYVAICLSDMPEKPTVSFALPGAVEGRDALNIFLIAMAEDVNLRTNEERYERVGLEWVSKPPPLRVKCTYIVSAWPAAVNPADAALAQLRLLGAAFKLFASIRTIPPNRLPAAFRGVDLPAPVIALTKDDLSHRSEFWVSAGCMFHPAFAFDATISLSAAGTGYDHVVEHVQIGYEING
jgi:hypothetical protein